LGIAYKDKKCHGKLKKEKKKKKEKVTE